MGTINLAPYKPVAGTTSDAGLIDNAFDTIQNVINGNIDNNNVKVSAGIDPLKIAGTLGKIFDSTLGGTAASFDINPLSTSYAHLLIELYLRGDTAAANANVYMRFNNDSAGNYEYERFTVNNATVTGAGNTAQGQIQIGSCPANTAPANCFSAIAVHVPHYAGGSNQKSGHSQGVWRNATGAGGLVMEHSGFFWLSTAQISRVTILPQTGNFVADSRCTVYGMGV